MTQIAIRLADEDLAQLDAAVAGGRYPTRAAAVRAGIDRLLREERDLKIAEQYRRAYGAEPQDEALGQAGALLMASALGGEETSDPHNPTS
ncbi:MAG: ribbon-helix-helix domain-containing protein [Solirubrobacteraceae bacterium]